MVISMVSAVCYGWTPFGRPSDSPLEGWASLLARGRFSPCKGWAGRAGVGSGRAFISPCKGVGQLAAGSGVGPGRAFALAIGSF